MTDKTVVFELEVDVHEWEISLQEEEGKPDEKAVIEAAKAILESAPSFDTADGIIHELEFVEVRDKSE
jgi:hypothetical protein